MVAEVNPLPRREATDWQAKGKEPMTRKQQNLLNSACGDLAMAFPRWHGIRFGKDDYRHLIAAIVLGERLVPGVSTGMGNPGLIRMSGRSTDFTRTEATEAIRMAFEIGDHPEDQGLPGPAIRWGETVVKVRYIAPDTDNYEIAA